MFITGLADEAAPDIEGQIAVHRELGWRHLEIRCVDGVNLCMADDALFEKTAQAVEAAGFEVPCLGASVANWSRPITGDFQPDLDELKRAIPRMHRLAARFIRVMSWPKGDAGSDDDWRDEAVRRMKELARIAEDGGVVLVHENCSGWGGQGPEQTLTLLERVDSPAFKLVWDTGNPIGHGQDAFAYYQAVRDHVVHVHIKDYKPSEEAQKKHVACFPGEGLGAVRQTLADLLGRGYGGGFTIEPHMAGQIHLGEDASRGEAARELYIEYGRRLEAILEEVRQPAS